MAQKIINTKIREAYDTEANWIKHNPVLLAGQLAFSSDKYGKYKVGNGTSTWSQLQYVTLNWGDIGGKPSSFAPTTHNHTISQITDIGNASVKYATTAGSANTTSQIIDPSDKHGINISYVDEVNTTSWIPVYKDRNHMSTISTNNLRNAIGAAASSHSHSNYATTTNLSLANQRIDAHEKELGVHKTLIDGKASFSHNHDTIYAKSSHYHNTINDCNSGTSIGISSTLGIVPSVSEKYDIVVTNTSEFGNKFVTMDKDSFIDKIPLKAITNSQIDSLASL